MTITKCDVCKKIISEKFFDEKRSHISFRYPFVSFELCPLCTNKLIPILEKQFHLSVVKK